MNFNKCKHCMDFDKTNNQCLIRFTILKDKTRAPMKRTPNQKACTVFMNNN